MVMGRERELLFKKGRGLYYYYPKNTREIFEVRRYENGDYCLRGDKSYNFGKLDHLLKHKGEFGEFKVFFKEIKSDRTCTIKVNDEMIKKFTKEKKVVAFPVRLSKNRASLKERESLGLEHNGQLLLQGGNLYELIGRNHCRCNINCDTNQAWKINTNNKREVYVFDIAKIYSYTNDNGKDDGVKKKITLGRMLDGVYILEKDIYKKYNTNGEEEKEE